LVLPLYSGTGRRLVRKSTIFVVDIVKKLTKSPGFDIIRLRAPGLAWRNKPAEREEPSRVLHG
jgi:hypothetical protein